MSKADTNKTKVTKQTPTAYIKTLTPLQQAQAKKLLAIFKQATGMKPIMWGNIIGFGSYHYVYESGREGDFIATGFAMRKSGPTIYILPGYQDYSAILKTIGPHKLGKSCLYFTNVEQLHEPTLQKLIKTGLKDLSKQYPVQRS